MDNFQVLKTLEVFHVHSYQDQFIQPGWAECFLYLAYVSALCVQLCFFISVSPCDRRHIKISKSLLEKSVYHSIG